MYKSYLQRKLTKIMNSNKQKSRKRAAPAKPMPEKKNRDEETQDEEATVEISSITKHHPSTSSVKGQASTKTAPPSVKPPNRSVLQLKITLQGITPPIWRRIQVLNNNTFYDLHNHIKEAMGWMTAASHHFIVQNPKNDGNILIVDGAMEGIIYDFKKDRGKLFKEQTTKLSKYLTTAGDVILYEFDLAESWMHHIVVEKILPPPPPKAEYPKIKAGKRACPPPDVGGADGYMHLLEVYNNPAHEEYGELIQEWLQDMAPGFDPEKFDRKKIFKNVWMWLLDA